MEVLVALGEEETKPNFSPHFTRHATLQQLKKWVC
jgi:hypothetical protein